MNVAVAPSARIGGFVLVAAATGAVAVVSNGSLGAAFAPAVVLAAGAAALVVPLRFSLAAMLFVGLVFHNPGGSPMNGLWQGPLYSPGEVLFDNLRHIVGIDALRFCALELIIAAMVLVTISRLLSPDDPDGARALVAPRPLALALVLVFLTVLTMAGWGLVRGGDFRQLLWQVRQIGWTPILASLFIVGLRTPAAMRLCGGAILAAAVVRSLEGAYFYFFVLGDREVPYIITHEDSILLVTSLFILGAAFLEKPSRRTLGLLLLLAPLLVFVLFMNGRRLAYISLLAAALTLVVVARPLLKRSLKKLALVGVPLVVLYVIAGWSSEQRFFAPVQALRSVGDEKNLSTANRDIENYNLVRTLSRSPALGSGFGHPYDEVRVGDSISSFMENYRYIPHNFVLGLWSMTGLVGFSLLWLPLPLVVFLAALAYRRCRDATTRVAAQTCIAVVIAYMVQAYGDMGLTGWMSAFLFAAAIGTAANLAVLTRAWPAGARVRP